MEQTEQVYKLIQEGDLHAIHLLLQNGFNPNQSVSCYDSFLECSLDKLKFDIAKLLIEFSHCGCERGSIGSCEMFDQ